MQPYYTRTTKGGSLIYTYYEGNLRLNSIAIDTSGVLKYTGPIQIAHARSRLRSWNSECRRRRRWPEQRARSLSGVCLSCSLLTMAGRRPRGDTKRSILGKRGLEEQAGPSDASSSSGGASAAVYAKGAIRRLKMHNFL